MITLNNSNIDFDIDSSNSILLSNSNLVFRTKTLNRMTITNDGNVGIGTELPIAPLQVAGNVNSTGLITSTGEGFEGSGFKLYNIPIEAVNNLGITLQSLSGNTASVVINVTGTSNNLVNRIKEETLLGSNYTFRVNNELNASLNTASNNLVNRTMMEVGRGSNYTLATSNTLTTRVMDEVALGSNYTGRLGNNISNYIVTSSNTLTTRIMDEVALGSNYTGRLGNNISNYIVTSSNTLTTRIMDEVALGSNYTGRLGNNISNYIVTSSNTLTTRIMDEVALGSNYTGRLGNNISNYIVSTSNTLTTRIMDEVALGSNYTGRLGNNISNYIVTSSNALVNRVLEEVGYGSNYTSSHMTTTSNILVNRVMTEVGFGSNFARDTVGVWGSNYADLSGKWGSNYTERLHAVALVSSQWATKGAGSAAEVIHYTSGNIGIGTATPVNILHIYSSNNSITSNNNNLANAKITIQESNTSNSFSSYPSDITSSPSVASVAIEGTTDKYMVFPYTADNTGTGQTQYTITLPENYNCDVLMVAGGGGGGGDVGGGGGGGAVLYGSNVIIPSGTYNIKVGNGGGGTGQNGYNTEAFGAICLGGGGAKNIRFDSALVTSDNDGNIGGSGGGGKTTRTATDVDKGTGGGVGISTRGSLFSSATSILYNGFAGGNGVKGTVNVNQYQSAGGGGASSKGGEGKPNSSGEAGQGGNGVEVNIVAFPDKNNPLCWGAGGGGGSAGTTGGVGGKGGGGSGSGTGTIATNTTNAYNSSSGLNAGAGTGSGGGGGGLIFQSNGGNGGSGIIIIRYRDIIGVKGNPEMQLVIGNNIAAGCSNYKIGNYNGDFQIKTSTSNIDRSSFVIQGNANVGVGTSKIASKLHVFDNNFNAILTLQDNTSVPVITTPDIITAATAPPLSTSVVSSYYNVAVPVPVVPPAIPIIPDPIYEGLLILPYTTDSTGYLGQSRYTFTTTENINADILVVAGGGAGASFGGGGGSGQVLLTTGYNIESGVAVSVNVGRGGIGNSTPFALPPIPIPGLPDPLGMNGANTSITIDSNTFTANGGGAGGSCSFTSNTSVGVAGGSGGGSSSGYSVPASLGGVSTKSQYFNWKSFGNSGGIGTYRPGAGASNIHFSGAGGGAGYLGTNGIYSSGTSGTVGAGGVGIDLSAIFGTSVGALGWFGGGGGGMSFGTAVPGGAGGTGGGGQGAAWVASILNGLNGANGVNGTGGGGGGGNVRGGDGGSGVVIIRFRRRNLEGNSEIQLIKGTSISAGNTNYKIGNYGGDYKIKTASYNTDTDRFVIQSNGNVRFNNTSGLAVATIFNNGDFRTAGSQISDSDHRIKKDVADIDEEGALRMIMEIEPKTYRYIDEERSAKGSGSGSSGSESRVYGFIAQQIRDVIPDATELRKNFLPNIMKRAIMDNDKVYLDLTGFVDLPLNDVDRKINIRFKNGGGYNFSITEVNKEYFVIDNAYRLIEEVIVYGYEVNDFHILTKDYIYTLNVSATQELCRKMEAQERRIKELEDKLERLAG